MKVDLIDIMLFIVLAQLISFTIYLISALKGKRLPIKLFILFIISKTFCILGFLVFRLWDYTYNHFPHLFYIGTPFSFLWAPAMYFYIISRIQPDFKIKKTFFVHLLPSIVVFVLLFINFFMYDAASKKHIIYTGELYNSAWFNLLNWFNIVSVGGYIVSSWKKLYKNHSFHFSFNDLTKRSDSWLLVITVCFTLKWLLDGWYSVNSYLANSEAIIPLFISRIDLIFAVNYILFKTLRTSRVFESLSPFEMQDTKRLSLSKAKSDKYLSVLKSKMETEKLFMDFDLTPNNLAQKTGIPVRSLSEIINVRLGQNFYDYVNKYRIEEAVKILSNPDSGFKTILEVMFEVGFNNKTSFNTYFKKYTGKTPTRFKQDNAYRVVYSY